MSAALTGSQSLWQYTRRLWCRLVSAAFNCCDINIEGAPDYIQDNMLWCLVLMVWCMVQVWLFWLESFSFKITRECVARARRETDARRHVVETASDGGQAAAAVLYFIA